jgi:hypothetical protein
MRKVQRGESSVCCALWPIELPHSSLANSGAQPRSELEIVNFSEMNQLSKQSVLMFMR